jgi:hypothetical protein
VKRPVITIRRNVKTPVDLLEYLMFHPGTQSLQRTAFPEKEQAVLRQYL